jgi:hypothetical protein
MDDEWDSNLDACPDCGATTNQFAIKHEERADRFITECSCRICGYWKSKIIVPRTSREGLHRLPPSEAIKALDGSLWRFLMEKVRLSVAMPGFFL